MIVIVLPSKTTHKLQPLDVGVFSTVQQKWSKHCDENLAQGVCINRYNFIPEYLAIHHTIAPSLVQKAFAKTGIYPLNPNTFNDNDFAPSQASSSMPAFPPSYPHEGLSPVPLEPSEMADNSEDQDGLESPTSSHFSKSPTPSLSTDSIIHPAPIMSQPRLPQLPLYDHVIRCTPKEIWNFMRLHQIQCKKVLKEVTAQHDAANALYNCMPSD